MPGKEKKSMNLRIPFMILSSVCGISLYGLGLLSREMDTGYILACLFIFLFSLVEPLILNIWRYLKEKERQEKLLAQKRAREKLLAEKRKKEAEAEEQRLAEERRKELLTLRANAQDELRARELSRERKK